MASEISWRGTATGATDYATIRSSARQYWNTSGTPALENLTVANWANYAIALAETPASSYFYVGSWPAGLTTAGWYWVDVYKQVGGSPAISDSFLGTLLGYWNGTTFEPWADNAVQVGGTAQTARDIGATLGVAGAGLTAIGDTRLANLDGTVTSRASQSSVDDLPTNAELATALAGADDAVLAAIAALNNLSQANIRSAVGLASANLDTQIDALPTAAENAAALMDLADGIETGITPRQSLRLALAALAGTVTGAGTATIEIQQAGGATVRIRATCDADGNRTVTLLDAS